MLDVAHMGLHVAQMTAPAQMRECYRMVTETSAQIMGLDFGLEVGKRASLIILDAADPIDAIRRRPTRTHVISNGKVVSRGNPQAFESVRL
jgi:cytosine deaminase